MNPIYRAVEGERARANARRRAAFEAMRDEDMGGALAYAMGGPEPTRDSAIRFVGMPFTEMVSTLLGFRGDVRWSSAAEMFARGISTGDVPALLEGAGNRVLRAAYQSFDSGLLRLCERIETRDLRDVKAIQVDGELGLEEVHDGGPFAEGTARASAETFPISTFGKIFALSRHMFAGDDLQAFGSLAQRLGRAAAEFTAGKIAALLESNPTLSDGVATFHSTHGNLGSAGALSETTLGELLKLMRAQKGLDATTPVAAVPRALVVPAALEVTGAKLLATVYGPNPPIELVVEPRLTSPVAHYLLADPSTVPAIGFTYGPGSDGPTIEVASRPGTIGLQAKIKLDVGCGVIDHRGAVRNAGG